MNKERKKRLGELSEQITDLKYSLEAILEEEETYMYNIPENLQGSARYEAAEEAVDNLESAIDSLDDTLSYIGAILE